MKKLMLGVAAAASVVAAAAPASAQTFGWRGDRGRVEQVQRRGFDNRDYGARNWSRGDRFDRSYATNYRMIDNRNYYRMREAPRDYRWGRSGNNTALVALASGLIGAVVGNGF